MKKYLLLLLMSAFLFGQDIIQKGNIYYLSNTLVIKFKQGVQPQSIINSIQSKNLPEFSISEMNKMFSQPMLKKSAAEESLDRVYLVKYNSKEDPLEVSQKINKSKLVEYAEPKYVYRTTFTPNDSLYVFQSNLSKISASKAWEVTKGDSSVIIAIVDTGVEWDHPDLSANIYRDINGKVVGYDFGGLNGTPDDDPREDPEPSGRNAFHGTHVAGIACAVSNNKTGIASIGYNCSIMPVKVTRSDKRDANGNAYVYYGFEGIKFAADHGAKIINCSWGGGSQSRYEQEVVDYATAKGALVVASAGNDGALSDFYPASYKNVLSVVWSSYDDTKYSAGNYGMNADVMSPGSFILSTWPTIAPIPELYYSISGSSMSAPLVSGLAGLVASRFPSYSPIQIGEQIRATADDVYSLNSVDYKYYLGRGRINAEKAVSDLNAISVRASNINFVESGNGNGLFERNETINVRVDLTNYLSTISNLSVSVETSDPTVAVMVLTSNTNIASMQNLQTIENAFNFGFEILPTAPYNHTVNFLLKFSSGTYSDYQWFSVRINPTFLTINNNDVAISTTSKGAFGFNDYPNNTEGVGFILNNRENMLFEGAFMYGTSETRVMDAARAVQTQSTDFTTTTPVFTKPSSNGIIVAETKFDDSGASTSSLGIETTQTTTSIASEPNTKFVIVDNIMWNKTSNDINNVYAGFFFDWDIPSDNSSSDTTAYDYEGNFGYAHYSDLKALNLIAGAALISSDNSGFNFYPIDNAATTGDVRLFDGDEFSDREKWITLSSGIVQKNVGIADVSFVVSYGPFNIKANSYGRVAFAIAADTTLNGLRASIIQSRKKYLEMISDVKDNNEIPTTFELSQNYPNPFNPETIINYKIASYCFVKIVVYDVLGKEISVLVNEFKQPGNYRTVFNSNTLKNNYKLPSGIYFYKLQAGDFVSTKKMIILK